MPNIITGHTGSAHVTSAQQSAINRGLIGELSETAILPVLDKLEAEIISNNKVRIYSGIACVEGRYVEVSSYEDVSIDNGTQGKKRYDAITLTHVQNLTTQVESFIFEVYKGAPATSDPEYPTPEQRIEGGSEYTPHVLYYAYLNGISLASVDLGGNVLTMLGMESLNLRYLPTRTAEVSLDFLVNSGQAVTQTVNAQGEEGEIPLAVVGLRFEGTGYSWAMPYRWHIDRETQRLSVSVRNLNTSGTDVNAICICDVLYATVPPFEV